MSGSEPELRIASRVYVLTPNGEREIQLCLGDITALPMDQKVDVLIISAFCDDYTPLRTSVIGALKYKLGLNVGYFARHYKKEDLRRQFNCWISNPLPETMPYRQMLCFEQPSNVKQKPTLETVRGLFRAMMPIFNYQNKSAITPLLATGSQHVPESTMMEMMLELAIQWMQMGLPLQQFKIVVYSRSPNDPNEMQQDCIKVFKVVKDRVERQRVKTVSKGVSETKPTVDVFLVYPEVEKSLAETVCKNLRKQKKKMQIISVRDLKIKEGTWQHSVFAAMMTSAKVIPILTTTFLEDVQCIDQYNIALCCNRQTRRRLLAPLCMDRINDIPVYMGMVQWENCRPRDPEKIEQSCRTVVKHIGSENSSKKLQQYDVFISYCHKNKTVAEAFLNQLKKEDGSLHVFFDTDELKTGVSWQQTLYHALDETRCMLALVSKDYLASPVCNEELNLALVKHLGKNRDMLLLPICIEEVEPIPAFQWVRPLKLDRNHLETIATRTSKAIINWLKTEERDLSVFSEIVDPLDFQALSCEKRGKLFTDYYTFKQGTVTFIPQKTLDREEKTANGDTTGCDLFLSYTLSDQKHVSFFTELLKQHDSGLKTNNKFDSTSDEMTLLDSAKCWVIFLSSNYLKSTKEMDELNQILSRQRMSKSTRRPYVVLLEELPIKPTYVYLMSSDTSLCDDLWEDVTLALSGTGGKVAFAEDVVSAREKVETDFGALSSKDTLALLKAACDIKELLSKGRYLPNEALGSQKCVLNGVVELQMELQNNIGSSGDPVLSPPKKDGALCHGDDCETSAFKSKDKDTNESKNGTSESETAIVRNEENIDKDVDTSPASEQGDASARKSTTGRDLDHDVKFKDVKEVETHSGSTAKAKTCIVL